MSKKRKWKKGRRSLVIVLAILVSMAVGALAYAQWGADLIADIVPVDYERSLGDGIHQSLEENFPSVELADVEREILNVVRLIRSVHPRSPAWTEHITVSFLEMPIPNAFALPGGHLVFTTVLLCNLEQGEELGYIIAHEMGHVYHRHPLRLFVKHVGISLIFSMLMRNEYSSSLSGTLLLNQYSRTYEKEADRFALVTGQRLGWSSVHFVSGLERISKMIGDDGNGGEALAFRDHPLLTQRTAMARNYPEGDPSTDSLRSLRDAIHRACIRLRQK